MKPRYLLLALALVAAACTKPNKVQLDEAFDIEQPAPKAALTRVALDATQQGYVSEGNKLAFKVLQQLANDEDGSFVCSPLSLQLALAMTSNGAEGETLQEMLDVLGYGHEGMAALNGYARTLIEQLPALDLDVTLKMADAMLVTDRYRLQDSFQKTLRDFYYAPAVSLSFDDKAYVLAQVNEWARRHTEGLIDPMLDEVSPNAVAFLMNALYFKAKWQSDAGNPMFDSQATRDEAFYKSDGSKTTIPFMRSNRHFPYADLGDFEMVALPYASGKYFMYVLLPKTNDGLSDLLESLRETSWNELISSLKREANVSLLLPRFEVSGDFLLNQVLKDLGMRRAFDDRDAEFNGMFAGDTPGFYISRVLQKAKITVAEWGTEAAAVTVVEMNEKSALPDKMVYFKADHPFVFVIGEQASGAILFEGVFDGN